MNLAAASEEIMVAAADNNQERVEIAQLYNKVRFVFIFLVAGSNVYNHFNTNLYLLLSRCAKI